MSEGAGGGREERFGVREGIVPKRQPQGRQMDHRLRNDIWNVFYTYWPYGDEIRAGIWAGWAEMALDELGRKERTGPDSVLPALKKKYWEIGEKDHCRVYEFVEAVCGSPEASRRKDFARSINSVLADNLSVYRLASCRLERTMSRLEHDGVKKASKISPKSSECIAAAMEHMGPTRPNYEAPISESVKMVEHAIQKAGGGGGGLNSLVESVSERLKIHPVMREQFSKMCGFANKTSRHSEPGEQYGPDLSDAKAMLVWCAAMANYLHDKAATAGSGRQRQ